MNEFLETGGINESLPPLENPGELMEATARQTMKGVGNCADLSESDASWLETLLNRIVQPMVDLFDGEESGYDTERLAPSDTEGQVTEGMESYNISEATEEWHVQEGNYSCAVCTQQFIINEFLDLELTETELCDLAESKGWYEPKSGTTLNDVGNLLELYGIDTQTNYEGTIQDIKAALDQGGRVIVAVDSMVLWTDGFGNYPVYGMDHAIEIIGIDDSDPLDVRVIVNDSGIEGGCGQSIPYLEFMEAWAPSGGFMVSAYPNDA